MYDGAFLTQEYTYDVRILQKFYEKRLMKNKNVDMHFKARLNKIIKQKKAFVVEKADGSCYEVSYILNATYASVNQILDRVEGMEKELFNIKYELL